MKCKSQTGCQNRKQLPYSGDALRWDLIRLRDVWRESRRQHDRFSIFKYLAAVYDLVSVWKKENRDIERAKRALRLKNQAYGNTIEPFAAIISCTSSRKVVDVKARSKWARALTFAAKYKPPTEPLEDFIRRHGELIHAWPNSVGSADLTRRVGSGPRELRRRLRRQVVPLGVVA
jgi:hypothetical protein